MHYIMQDVQDSTCWTLVLQFKEKFVLRVQVCIPIGVRESLLEDATQILDMFARHLSNMDQDTKPRRLPTEVMRPLKCLLIKKQCTVYYWMRDLPLGAESIASPAMLRADVEYALVHAAVAIEVLMERDIRG